MSETAEKTLSEAIRERRKALGITQAQLADLSGVSVRAIFELENGNKSMSFKRVLLILEALGLQFNLVVAPNG
jgi:y4mF family transcriptional regulator